MKNYVPVGQYKMAYSIPGIGDALGLSRQKIYDEINAGRLETYTVGTRRFASHRALEAYIAAREAEARQAAEATVAPHEVA